MIESSFTGGLQLEWLFELIGSGGALVGVAWLGKEVFSGYLRRSDAKKLKKLEFQQYKRQANFDLKYKVYSQVYSKIKELQGTLMTYRSVQSFYVENEEALYSRNNKKFFIVDQAEPEEFKGIYYANEHGRVLININHINGLIDERHLDLKNYSAINEFLFTEKEALAIKEIIDYSRDVIDKISLKYVESFEEVNVKIEREPNNVEEIIEESLKDFEDKLDSFLEKNLIEINNMIRKTDTLFRKEFDAH